MHAYLFFGTSLICVFRCESSTSTANTASSKHEKLPRNSTNGAVTPGSASPSGWSCDYNELDAGDFRFRSEQGQKCLCGIISFLKYMYTSFLSSFRRVKEPFNFAAKSPQLGLVAGK